MRSYLYLTIVIFHAILSAKTKLVEGKITNEIGVPLSNVNIVSMPSETGAQSNEKGDFSFKIPIKDRELSIDHIGHENITLNAIVFKNGTVVQLKEKVIEMDSLDVTASNRNEFDIFESKNSVIHLDMDELSLRGFSDVGDMLFSEQSVLLNESMDGQKSASIRASAPEEMVYLYDGIRINTMGDPLLDLSLFSTTGISSMEVVKGGHEKALSSSGTINFIPKLSYDNTATFNQQFGTYNYGGYDGFGSLGFKYGTVNAGLSEGRFSQVYGDTSAPEIHTEHRRLFSNLGVRNNKNLEVRLMALQNERSFENKRTSDTVDLKMQNMIFKLIDSDPRGRSMSLYGLYQQYDGQESLADLLTNKNDINQGFGYEYERIIDNSKFRFATETNLTTADWVMDADNIILERQSSIFTGSFEIYQPENDKAYQFKDLKFVFSKHRVTDLPDTSADHLISDNYWDNNNTQFTASFLNKQPTKKLLLYVNIGNVFRVPSVDESISNQTYPYLIFNSNDLLPEQKSMYELGLKIENIPKEPGDRTYSLLLSGFSYSYYDKIKQLHLSGTPIKYPINFGQASIAGIEADLSYQPTRKWISLKTCLSNYILSDPLAFQLQPEQMLRSIISIKNKWFNMDLIYRSESSRQITTIEQNGVTKQATLKPISNIDLNIYRVFKIAFVRSTISFSGKNLNSSPQELEGISIYDRRYALNINISL